MDDSLDHTNVLHKQLYSTLYKRSPRCLPEFLGGGMFERRSLGIRQEQAGARPPRLFRSSTSSAISSPTQSSARISCPRECFRS